MFPTFVISLDFELFWGVLESKTLKDYGSSVLGAHLAIPAMLELFERYRVDATFATVGFLFHQDSSSLRSAWPNKQPQYENSRLSSYEYPFEDNEFFFAPKLIDLLKATPQHEIATHTFSHYYCGAKGADLDSFRCDLKAAIQSGHHLNIEQTSIVFPRNQVESQFLEVCREQKLLCFRGNQTSWIYRTPERRLPGRILRLLDSYINLSGPNCQAWTATRHQSGMTNIRASAMLRPHRPRLPWLDRLQLRRIRQAMTHAAQKNKIYHLWWHPHNFGENLPQNLKNLEHILQIYRELAETYGMVSQTMREAAQCSVTSL